jgi:putative transposase
MEAYLHGVSTRKVDDLVKALGADTGISKSEITRICADLHAEVGQLRDRPITDAVFPYVFLDATYCKARINRRVVSQAVVVATGVRGDGWREVLGSAVGDSEDGAFWTAFLRSLKDCATSWPRCRRATPRWSPPQSGPSSPSPTPSMSATSST